MSNSSQIVKANRANIKLGNIELDGYQMPDGSYMLSATQVAKACNLNPMSLPQTFIKSQIETLEGVKEVALIDMDRVPLLWLESDTPEGKGLAYACMAECLERRLDAVSKKV